jgi:hypothetical protein
MHAVAATFWETDKLNVEVLDSCTVKSRRKAKWPLRVHQTERVPNWSPQKAGERRHLEEGRHLQARAPGFLDAEGFMIEGFELRVSQVETLERGSTTASKAVIKIIIKTRGRYSDF